MARAPRPGGSTVGGMAKEAIKEKLRQVGEGFVSGATGGTLGNFRIAPAAAADTGVEEQGRQSPPSGDPQKDVVNAVRDLQSDFNGQHRTLKSINANLSTQIAALDSITKQLGLIGKLLEKQGGRSPLDQLFDKDVFGAPEGQGKGKAAGGAPGKQAAVKAMRFAAIRSALGGVPGLIAGEAIDDISDYFTMSKEDYERKSLARIGAEPFAPGEREKLIGEQQAKKEEEQPGMFDRFGKAFEEKQSAARNAIMGFFGYGEKPQPQVAAPVIDNRPPVNFAGNAFDMSLDFTKPPAPLSTVTEEYIGAHGGFDTPAMQALAAKQEEKKDEEKNIVTFTAKEMVFKADLIKFEQIGQPQQQMQFQQQSVQSASRISSPSVTSGSGGGAGVTAVGGGQTEQILATIKQRESSGNYQARSSSSSASGAYQFIDGTWQGLTKKFGIGQEYKRAVDAPKEVQDAVAKKYVEEILQQNNGDVSKVPLVWYTGNAQGAMSQKALAANKGQTAEQYQSKWMADFAKVSGGTTGGTTQQFAQGGISAGVAGVTTPAGGTGALQGALPAGFAPSAIGPSAPAPSATIPGAASAPATPGYGATSQSATASKERFAERIGQNGMLPDSELVSIGGRHRLNKDAAGAYQKMVEAAAQDGITWTVSDSYRTYDEQVAVARKKGLYSQGGLAATPGTSNHGWGKALDLNVGGAGSKQYQWLAENAGKFGFKTIAREPWHWEYTGGAEAVSQPQIAGGGGRGGRASMEGAPAGGAYGGQVATLSGAEQRQMERAFRGGTAGVMPMQGAAGGLGMVGSIAGGLFGGRMGGALGGLLGAGVGSLIDSMTTPAPTTGAQAMQKSFETSSYVPLPPSRPAGLGGGESTRQTASQDTSKPSYQVEEPYISAKDLTRIFGITYA